MSVLLIALAAAFTIITANSSRRLLTFSYMALAATVTIGALWLVSLALPSNYAAALGTFSPIIALVAVIFIGRNHVQSLKMKNGNFR